MDPAWLLMMATVTTGGAPPDAAAGWRSPGARCEAMADRLDVATGLRPVVADLCQRAPTFRRQVARLASHPDLVVTVRLVVFPELTPWRARTTIERVAGNVTSADVQVQAGDPQLLAELIAHEFEHVLEQLDDVDLSRWIGRAGVRRVGSERPGSAIETERATQVGLRVAGEYRAAPTAITAARRR